MAQELVPNDPVLRAFFSGASIASGRYQSARAVLEKGVPLTTAVPGLSGTTLSPHDIELELALMLRECVESRSPLQCNAEGTSVLTVAGLGEYLGYVRLARGQLDILKRCGLAHHPAPLALRPVWLQDQVRKDTTKEVLGRIFSRLRNPAREVIQDSVNSARIKPPVCLAEVQFF
ncbi:MAG TPA: hypothetical protein VMT80_01700 [Candidatus Paceibacterota bacterium]|nr:hypothetical protein [Candidatus Paceibacterota bacterium]